MSIHFKKAILMFSMLTLNLELANAAMEVNPGAVDMNYGQWGGAGNLDNNQAICVHAITTVGACPTKKCTASDYDVTAVGNPGGTFRVYDMVGGVNFIDYRAFYNDKQAIAGGTELTTATTLTNQTDASNRFPCNKNTGNIRILFEEVGANGLLAAPPGYYSGQLATTYLNQSTGETFNDIFNISVSIGRMVRIAGLNDLILTPGAPLPYSGLESFCVFDNDLGAAGYNVTASSANANAGQFRLHINVGGIDYFTPYNVWYDGSASASAAGAALTSGSAASPFFGSPQLDCGGLDNASIYIESAAPFVSVGTYTDTLTINIQPN
jgi:hypothetical protein